MLMLLKCNNNQLKSFVFCRWKHSKGINSNLKFLLETMPKQRIHVQETQKQRKHSREKSSKYVPGRITLQVLGTGATGAPRSLYVFSDQSRYLFNCGEGTQRLAHEHKMKLGKLEHIFITQCTWNNIGGLPGTALTIQDVGVPQITLHGPKGLDEMFNATKRFIIIRDLRIEVAECRENMYFEDNVMKVQYVKIRKSSKQLKPSLSVQKRCLDTGLDYDRARRSSRSPETEVSGGFEDYIDYYAHEQSRKVLIKANNEPSRLSYLKNTKKDGITMCYICKLQPRPGALSLEKCVKYGVPSGPLLGKLKMGEDIILPSGVVVRSIDVREPDDPGPIFLVVDCPSEDYLEAFVQKVAFKAYQQGATSDDLFAYLVVHFTPAHIVANPEYKRWINQFKPSTHHLFVNESNTCMGSESVHRIQYKLNLLYENFFPLLGDQGSRVGDHANKRTRLDDGVSESHSARNNSISGTSNLADEFNQVNTFCSFHLRPKKGLDRSNELLLKPTEYIKETMAEAGFNDELTKLRESLKDTLKNLIIRHYPKFLFLGTGSCIPNKTRNTSGILYHVNDNTSILLDCGEGTYGQLVRFYGICKANKILCNLKAIFISHLHADHHIGLIGVLQGRRKAIQSKNSMAPRVLLLAPKQIMTWLKFYDDCFEDIFQEFQLIPNDGLLHEEQTLFEGTKVQLYCNLGMTDICTTYVRHCPNAFGIAFTSKDGSKICYSGDTMPSENLINLGNRCDLLIHEATMEDELEEEALLKMHSTTSQAIEVGRNMFAKHILLTHFSQRYAKLPKFNDNFTANVGIAFDNMQICLDELPILPLLYPALRIMFAEHYEELETKTMKRQLRLEKTESRGSLSSSTSSKETDNSECSTNFEQRLLIESINQCKEIAAKRSDTCKALDLNKPASARKTMEVENENKSEMLMQVDKQN